MSKYSFEEAKQKVSEKYGYQDWEDLYNTASELRYNPSSTLSFYQNEAAETLAKSWANEAVREDRDQILVDNPVSTAFFGAAKTVYIDRDLLNIIPLPYPEVEQ